MVGKKTRTWGSRVRRGRRRVGTLRGSVVRREALMTAEAIHLAEWGWPPTLRGFR